MANKASVPIVLHLDHGEDFDFIKQAIDLGFTSVMIDASKESLENNIEITKSSGLCSSKKRYRRGELGHVGAGTNYENHETTDSIYTEVKDVQTLSRIPMSTRWRSRLNRSRSLQGTPVLNFERLAEIKQITDVPLVYIWRLLIW